MIFSILSLFTALIFCPVEGASLGRRTDASTYHGQCRCFPGDACWPNQNKWNALNATVGGRLVATVPLASACHDSPFGPYDETKCKAIQSAWYDPATHIKSTSSLMAPYYANQSCDPFLPRGSSCVVGSYVQYAVDAQTTSDYQAAIKFATQNNIRLVIRNTAHDWLGKSTGAGALSIRTYNLKSTQIVDYKSSYYTGKALKVGAGVSLGDAYKATHAQGLVNVGGTCPTVGLAGGYTQGAGHGLSVSKYGLGADQALEWEVVTAAGKYLKATPKQNSDLYWALSGGGGGTYAAVLSLTIKVYQDETTAAANLTWTNAGVTQETFYKGVEAYMKTIPAIVAVGASGNWLTSNTTFSESPMVGIGMTKSQMDALHQPLLAELDNLKIKYIYESYDFPTYMSMYTQMNPLTEVGQLQIGSRLIPSTIVQSKPRELTNALRTINEHVGAWISGLVFDASKAPTSPNAANPAWRHSSLSLVIGTFYDYKNWSVNLANQKLMTDTLVPQLAALIPGGGSAYQNEGDAHEKEWQTVFYGANYDRLVGVKTKYDPGALFYARTAVGSEGWVERGDGRLCRV